MKELAGKLTKVKSNITAKIAFFEEVASDSSAPSSPDSFSGESPGFFED